MTSLWFVKRSGSPQSRRFSSTCSLTCASPSCRRGSRRATSQYRGDARSPEAPTPQWGSRNQEMSVCQYGQSVIVPHVSIVSSQPRSFCRDSGRMTTKLSWRFAPRRRIILVEFVPGTAPTARPVGAQFGFRLKPDSGNRICKRHDVSGAKPGHGRTRRIKSIAMQFECELEDAGSTSGHPARAQVGRA